MREKLDICYLCGKIKLDGAWLERKDNPNLYDDAIIEHFKTDRYGILNLTLTLCHKDTELEKERFSLIRQNGLKEKSDVWPLEIPREFFE